MVSTHLSPYLLEYLDDYCRRRAESCPMGVCSNEEECQSTRLSLTVIADRGADPTFGEFRRTVKDLRCGQCTLVLILQAIHRNVPAKVHPLWLNKPLMDLDGRTPKQCLENGDFDPLINALWLLDQTELTCG